MDIVYFFIVSFIFLLFVVYIGVFFSSKFTGSNERVLYYWLLFLTVLMTIIFYLSIYFYVTIRQNRGPPGPPGPQGPQGP